MGNYDDIIDLPHYASSARPQMSTIDFAAQFSPYAALVGFDAAIEETGRLTDSKIELDEDGLNVLNMKFQMAVDRMSSGAEVTITYFKSDERKEGGAYLETTGVVAKLDEFERLIITRDGSKISMNDILDIDS